MTFTVDARLAARDLDVSFRVATGETLAVLGPNGSGKSSILNIIAGVLRPDAGRAVLGERTLFDVSRGVRLPAHRRGVALLTQESLLFPHLSVLDNVAFAPTCAGHSTAAARARARAVLATVGAADLALRRPAELSGGQAQRVALARALAAEPELLLLDEPFAALDVAASGALRGVVGGALAGRSAVFVTHEVLDALSLADRVVVLNRGRVVETGPTREVLEHPRHRFTAELAGLNLIDGVSTGSGLLLPDGNILTAGGRTEPGTRVAAAFRPTAVRVDAEPPAADGTVIPVTVGHLEPRNDLVRVRAGSLFADIAPGRATALGLGPNRNAFFSIRPSDVIVYPVEHEYPVEREVYPPDREPDER